MFRWYVINTYSGPREQGEGEPRAPDRLDEPGAALPPRRRPDRAGDRDEGRQKVQIEKRVLPGYVLVNMDLNDEAWTVVKNTPGVTGFVGAGAKPVPLAQGEVDRILHTGAAAAARSAPRSSSRSASR